MKTISIKVVSFVALLTVGPIHAGKEADQTNQEPITTQERLKHGAVGSLKAICTICTAFLPANLAYSIYKNGYNPNDISLYSLVPVLTFATCKFGASACRSLAQAFQRYKRATA